MRQISDIDIESELSYAYLHAVASKAGASCKIGTRHEDNNGVDAQITAWAPFPNGGYLREIDIKVQLKATIAEPRLNNGCISYSLQGISRYDDLRSEEYSAQRILVVLFLPRNNSEWLEISSTALILRNCAYWVSLRGAPASDNQTAQTIYIPETQLFTPIALQNIAGCLSRRETLNYQLPIR